jgi:hypothetical protein
MRASRARRSLSFSLAKGAGKGDAREEEEKRILVEVSGETHVAVALRAKDDYNCRVVSIIARLL